MIVNGVSIDDTFAEAFAMRGTRLIITVHPSALLRIEDEAERRGYEAVKSAFAQ